MNREESAIFTKSINGFDNIEKEFLRKFILNHLVDKVKETEDTKNILKLISDIEKQDFNKKIKNEIMDHVFDILNQIMNIIEDAENDLEWMISNKMDDLQEEWKTYE